MAPPSRSTQHGPLPGHVLTAFQVDAAEPAEPLGVEWGYGVRVGNTAFVPAGEHAHFSATVRDKLDVPGVRVARPLRTTDGRFAVAGWAASVWEAGTLSRRIDETVVAALRLADALRDVAQPELDLDPGSPAATFAEAERLAWAECDEKFGELSGSQDWQVGHADMVGTTIMSGELAPVVTDIVPFAEPRPAAFSAALAIVDGLMYGAVDEDIMDRFAHLQDLAQLTLRAIAYRRHVSDLHSETTSISLSNIIRVEELLMSRWSATI